MYYEEIMKKIRELIDDGAFNQALQLINEELKQPYVPLKIEKELIELQELYTPNEEKTIQIDAAYYLNNLCLRDVITYFDKINLRGYFTEIEYYLLNSKEYSQMTLLLLLMQEQAIERDFVVKKEKNYTINPKTMQWFTTYESYKSLKEDLKEVYRFNPSYFSMALEYVDAYYIEIYPKDILDYSILLKEVMSILN